MAPPINDLSQNNLQSSDSSDTDSEDSGWIRSDDQATRSSASPLFKSNKTPTSTLEPKTSNSKDIKEKARQMREKFVTPSITNSPSSPSATRTFICSPTTPSQSTSGARSASASRLNASANRLNAIQNALDTLNRTPSKPPRKSENMPKTNNNDDGVIVIEDSDEEATDIDSQPSTRPASFLDICSPSTNSSVSRANSLFSIAHSSRSVSASSVSTSDDLTLSTILSSPEQTLVEASQPSTFKHPVVKDDVLRPCPRVIQSSVTTQPTPTQHSQPLPFEFEDQIPGSLASFADSPFGTDLKPVIIAHDKATQDLLDRHQISWGTQYELARGVSLGTWNWEDVKEKVQDLIGNNAHAACKVQTVMRGKPMASANPYGFYLWKELDREQAAIEENEFRGLGLMGEWKGAPNWYGGQVQQIMRLVKDSTGYKLTLEPMEKRRSHRFARFYGSRRFLQVRVPEALHKENDAIRAFFLSKFILCGRVFVPFHSKDGGLYMVETDENWERESRNWCGDQFRMTFREFINWHNPLAQKKNYSQAMAKYSSRFALGLSNSVPAIEFATEDIYFIEDIAASDWPESKGKPPTEKLMTDGCGLINRKALITIVRSFNYENLPAGVQGRIDGSKGFWILHPTDESDVPKIWIRDSQNKIKNDGFDRAHRIFDLLCPSRSSSSIELSAQSIVNIFSNGIPASVLIELMEQGLVDEISPLLEWNQPRAMVFLWDAVNKCGSVSGVRTQRLAASLNRVLGLKRRDWGREENPEREDSDEDSKEDEPFSTFTGRNKHGGAPLSLHEKAAEMIQAGFHPARSKYLFDKIGYVIEQVIKSSVEKYRIPISESLGAYVVPDPLGILKEGEIFYYSSRPLKDPRTEMQFQVVTGDVLVGRYPIRLPSDMQKVKAVDATELYPWKDVVVISTQGSCSLASLLAGGDMDGDELIVIWDPLLVKDFENKPLTQCPTDVISEAFLPLNHVENVAQFCTRIYALPRRASHEAFQERLMANLVESNVGMYSTCHDNCVATYGYDHPKSIRLAYIVATLLDAGKTGHRLRPGILDKDRKVYSPWAPKPPSSDSILDILTQLKKAGEKKGAELLAQHKEAGSGVELDRCDNDLKAPYRDTVDHANEVVRVTNKKEFADELALIRRHVDLAKATYDRAISKKKDHPSPSKSKKSFRVKSDQEDLALKATREYAEPIPNILLIRNVEDVKASYAYILNVNFAFSVAFTRLCLIKALASSEGIAPSLRIFDEGKSFTPAFLRALRCENENDLL